MAMGQRQDTETLRGRTWARNLYMCDVSVLADAFVLDDFDWRDWFDDRPSGAFMRGVSDEVMFRDEVGE